MFYKECSLLFSLILPDDAQVYNKNRFCFVCGLMCSVKSRSSRFTENFQKSYKAYFGIIPEPKQDFIPDFACKSCFTRIENWHNGTKMLKLFKVCLLSKNPMNVKF